MSRILSGVVAATLILTGCSTNGPLQLGKGGTMQTATLFAMDTVMELQVYGGDEAQGLLSEAEQHIRDLEKELSVTDENSQIAQLNAKGSVQLSEEPAQIMREALSYCESTEGALDITIYPVLKAWGFTTGEYQVPGDEEIVKLLENVDYRNVELSDKSSEDVATGSDSADGIGDFCAILPGTQVDLGSVTKGYTSRTLAQFFRDKGVKSGLINLGGNVECIGSKPNGDPWNVAIKSPFKDSASGILGVIKASDEAIITSGGYERFFEENGEIYWHIIDPATGRPARNGLISVTIIGKDGLMCDALSTALFVKGLDGATEYYISRMELAKEEMSSDVGSLLVRSGAAFDMILVTEAGEVYITEGIADRFTLSSEYYNLKLHVIS